MANLLFPQVDVVNLAQIVDSNHLQASSEVGADQVSTPQLSEPNVSSFSDYTSGSKDTDTAYVGSLNGVDQNALSVPPNHAGQSDWVHRVDFSSFGNRKNWRHRRSGKAKPQEYYDGRRDTSLDRDRLNAAMDKVRRAEKAVGDGKDPDAGNRLKAAQDQLDQIKKQMTGDNGQAQ